MKRYGLLVAFGVLLASAGHASNGIAVTRGADGVIYGNCVPSLLIVNRSAQTIDFLQVDVLTALRDGRERTIELRSGYREGVPRPIAPGASATLRQQFDLSPLLGAPCADIVARRVVRTICEAGGKDCAAAVTVQP